MREMAVRTTTFPRPKGWSINDVGNREGGGVKNWSKLPTDTTKKLPTSGLSSLGVPGVPWHTQFMADQLTLFQPGGTDYAHLITTGTPGFSDLPTAL